jgi:branched-chain amino acid transport system substrate-binding protein
VKKYEIEYNKTPEAYAATAYDSAMIISQAISKVGYNATSLKDYLYQMPAYDGVSGLTKFDELGAVDKPVLIKTIRDGKFEVIS